MNRPRLLIVGFLRGRHLRFIRGFLLTLLAVPAGAALLFGLQVGFAALHPLLRPAVTQTTVAKTVPPTRPSLNVAIGAEPVRLDPHDSSDAPSSLIHFHVYDRLVEVEEDGDVMPSLATSWNVSEDGRRWHFTIRRGVFFHDGEKLTAEAVRKNLDRFLDRTPGKSVARRDLIAPYVAGVETVGEYELAIDLHEPFAPFLRYLAHESLSIVSPRTLEKDGGFAQPAGTGPFQFHRWVYGDRLILAAFDEHWRGPPHVAFITFLPVPEGSSRTIMLESGAVDVTFPVDPVHVARLKTTPGVRVEHTPSQRMIYGAINLNRPPMDDVVIRRALNYALDVDAITRNLLFGLARPAQAPMSELTYGFSPVNSHHYDPDLAMKLLHGRPNNFDRTIDLWSPSDRYLQDREVAQAVAAYFTQVGLDVRIRLFEWGSYLAALNQSDDWDIAILGWVPATGDADMALRPLFHSSSLANHGSYRSRRVDALLDEALRVQDADMRLSMYREVQEHIAGDVPILFMYTVDLLYAHAETVEGINTHSNEIVDLRFVQKLQAGRNER